MNSPQKSWTHKSYGLSFTIKRTKASDAFFEMLEQIKVCESYGMFLVLSGKDERPYRRGKNRCKRCGLKHNSLPTEPTVEKE